VVKRAAGIAALASLVMTAWAGCSSIIGIEEARLDSTPVEAGPPPTLCERYCDVAMANCPDLTGSGGRNFTLYFSRAECLATCAVFPEGNEGDESGNTIHCRLRAATLAVDLNDPKLYCPIAGPGGSDPDGADGCGSNCQGFCTMTRAVCLDTLEQLQSDLTDDNCDTFCAGLPDLGGFVITQDFGNSVQCRVYHASAATLDASQHCKHVGNKIDEERVGGPCDPKNDPPPAAEQ
jgi:hypothetical protein